jgi:hypothetical protein
MWLKVFFIITHSALLLGGSRSYIGETSQQDQHYQGLTDSIHE